MSETHCGKILCSLKNPLSLLCTYLDKPQQKSYIITSGAFSICVYKEAAGSFLPSAPGIMWKP